MALKFESVNCPLGSANWGVLKKFTDSVRNVSVASEPTLQRRETAQSSRYESLPYGRRNARECPRRPAADRRTPRGEASSRDVSGFPIVRPRIDGSSSVGRSP